VEAALRLRQLREVGLDVGRPLRALDVGGGAGVMRAQVEAATAWTVDLAELSLNALERATPGRGRRIYYDVHDRRPDLAGAFDIVILFDVLEHVSEPRRFVDALAHHLRPGGHLLINVPALPWLFSDYDREQGHFRRYRRATLIADIAGPSFEVVDVRYWGLILVPLLAARRLLVRRSAGRDVIRAGFRPPGPAAHAILRGAMRAETALLPRAPLGTSLLLAARRTVRERP